MSQNLKHALKHFWLWRKNYIFMSFGLSLLSSLLVRFNPIRSEFLDILFAGASFLFLFRGFTADIFSWKYYQSLPLSKKELYHYHLLIQYLIYLPFVAWYICFPDYVNDFVFDSKRVSWQVGLIVLGCYLLGTLFIGIASFYKNYESFRQPYVKSDKNIILLQFLRNSIYSVAVLIIAGIALFLVSEKVPVVSEILKWGAVFGGIAVVPVSFIWYYFYTFKRWNREELSYFKANFKVWRDVPLMAVGALFITFTYQSINVDQGMSGMYGKAGKKGIFKAIQTHNKKEFERLLTDKEQIHAVTETGWTPLMVAAHTTHGDGYFLQLLEAGASTEGKVNSPSDAFHNGLDLFMLAVDGGNMAAVEKLITRENVNAIVGKRSALHVAAFNCAPEMIDLLLEKGADPNVLNDGGSTALHVAARRDCFAGAVSLIEAGADPLIKNKKNEIALNLLKKNDKQFSYYLDKKGRLPAGK